MNYPEAGTRLMFTSGPALEEDARCDQCGSSAATDVVLWINEDPEYSLSACDLHIRSTVTRMEADNGLLPARDGGLIYYTEPSNDGNLDGGWVVSEFGESPALVELYEPRHAIDLLDDPWGPLPSSDFNPPATI